ncbi:MAG: hypothetical protein EOQ39_03695 [Mesorhizobium sp.]|uniref:hypothetical protein n=1 Tax=Mesorhizobium sp. TaxID=1871066 RepID=UPI000FE9FD15|nr:hypothetical protein [Mesorhizobium sp.]RWB09013.1 MAG: hypothetical protein EOQ37_05850 [Mesorhizobium sp.]RWB17434.1 MAG: hypothetical protein EOQ39_03695 [Mesorhizobium sp.]
MPNSTVRAAAEGLPNPQKSRLIDSIRSLVSPTIAPRAIPPGNGVKIMNAVVNRRTILSAAALAAGVSAAPALATKAVASAPIVQPMKSIDERLDSLPVDVANRLRAAFNKVIDEVEAMHERGESLEAVAAHIDNWGRVFHSATDAVTD